MTLKFFLLVDCVMMSLVVYLLWALDSLCPSDCHPRREIGGFAESYWTS